MSPTRRGPRARGWWPSPATRWWWATAWSGCWRCSLGTPWATGSSTCWGRWRTRLRWGSPGHGPTRSARRLLEREQAAREEIETINRLGSLVMAELDLEKLVQGVTDAATSLTGAQFGAFFYNVVGERGEAYTLYALSGVPREAFAGFPMPRNTAVFGPTFRGEGIVRLADVRADPRFGLNDPYWGMPPGHLPVVSYLAVSVVARSGEVLGGLFFGHRDGGGFHRAPRAHRRGSGGPGRSRLDNARLYREAQRALAVRNEFLVAVAHDLRTPLTAIKGSAQLLLRQANRPGGIPPERLAAGLAGLDTSATRMSRLVDHLLDVAHDPAGRAWNSIAAPPTWWRWHGGRGGAPGR